MLGCWVTGQRSEGPNKRFVTNLMLTWVLYKHIYESTLDNAGERRGIETRLHLRSPLAVDA